jgi:plastocyanin
MNGMMAWMLLFWLVLLGAGIGFIVALTKRDNGVARTALQERLARGEIDVDDFNRRMAAIDQTPPFGGRARAWLFAGGFALAVLIAIPMLAIAANDWDMLDLHGRGWNTSRDPIVRGDATSEVRIENFTFRPGNLEVAVGARVTWSNDDSAPHDATARNGDWKTDRLQVGESDTLTFESAGEYDYYCSIHPSMKARLVVR